MIDTRARLPYQSPRKGRHPAGLLRKRLALKKILSIDDDPKILEAIESALQQGGYEVLITTDPTAVEKIMIEHEIALVMLDIQMPQKSGIEVFKELKKKNPGMKILFVTGHAESFNVHSEETLKMWQEHFADGETDIMYKPFTLNILCEKVEGLIGPAGELA